MYGQNPKRSAVCPKEAHLASWINNQRILGPEVIQPWKKRALESSGIAWTWNQLQADWKQSMDEAASWTKQNGRIPKARARCPIERGHASWMSTQRQEHSNATLSEERVIMIQNSFEDWTWDAEGRKKAINDATWDNMFNTMIDYLAANNGEYPIDSATNSAQHKLYTWVKNQRAAYKNNTLSPDRISTLEGANINWQWVSTRRKTKNPKKPRK